MKVDIYRSAADGRYLLIAPTGSDLNQLGISTSLGRLYSRLLLHLRNEELLATDARAGLDVKQVLEEIEKTGYAAHKADVSVTIASKANGLVQ